MYYLYVERGLRRLCVIRQDLHVSFTMCVCVCSFSQNSHSQSQEMANLMSLFIQRLFEAPIKRWNKKKCAIKRWAKQD